MARTRRRLRETSFPSARCACRKARTAKQGARAPGALPKHAARRALTCTRTSASVCRCRHGLLHRSCSGGCGNPRPCTVILGHSSGKCMRRALPLMERFARAPRRCHSSRPRHQIQGNPAKHDSESVEYHVGQIEYIYISRAQIHKNRILIDKRLVFTIPPLSNPCL